MLRRAILPVLFALSAPLFAQTLNTAAPAKLIAAWHARGDFDGVVILSQNGQPILTTATGLADRSAKTPLHPQTLFRLASLTKQITALLILQQVGEGHLTLDQRAGDLMSALPPPVARVTIRQLLQHTSGLANPNDLPAGAKPLPDNVPPPFYTRPNLDDASNTATATTTCSSPAKRQPGTQFEYNNCDYIVLGAILETLTHQSFPQILRTRIVEPLGLKSWGIFPANAAKAPRVAKAYQRDGQPELFQNPATYGAAGALYGNALDVARWNEALLTHQLLSAELTATMFRADPKLQGEALGSWAYDTKLNDTPIHIVERQGDIGSTVLLNLLLPNQNASLIILSNNETPELFNTYSKKGIGYELLQAITTPPPASK